MKPAALVGIALLVLGVISFACQGITYRTREKTLDLGPLQITTERTHTVPLPPLLGALALVSGTILILRGKA